MRRINKTANLQKIIKSFISFYKSDLCIACRSSIKDTGSIFSKVYHDDYKKKSTIFYCKYCGMGYTYPFLSENELNKLYVNYNAHSSNPATKTYIDGLLALMSRVEGNIFKKIILSKNIFFKKTITSFLAPHLFQGFPLYTYKEKNKKIKILDYGCGDGYFLKLAQKAGCDVYGMEIEDEIVEKLNKEEIFVFPNLDDLMKSNIKFDVIRVNQVFEHIVNPNELLPIFHRMLKKKGELIIAVPNFNTLAKVFKKNYYAHLPFHRLHYTKKSIGFLLSSNKYKLNYIKTKSYGTLSWSLLGSIKMRSSIWANPIKLFELIFAIYILDFMKVGDGLEVYAQVGE